jgi:hypothetical protein
MDGSFKVEKVAGNKALVQNRTIELIYEFLTGDKKFADVAKLFKKKANLTSVNANSGLPKLEDVCRFYWERQNQTESAAVVKKRKRTNDIDEKSDGKGTAKKSKVDATKCCHDDTSSSSSSDDEMTKSSDQSVPQLSLTTAIANNKRQKPVASSSDSSSDESDDETVQPAPTSCQVSIKSSTVLPPVQSKTLPELAVKSVSKVVKPQDMDTSQTSSSESDDESTSMSTQHSASKVVVGGSKVLGTVGVKLGGTVKPVSDSSTSCSSSSDDDGDLSCMKPSAGTKLVNTSAKALTKSVPAASAKPVCATKKDSQLSPSDSDSDSSSSDGEQVVKGSKCSKVTKGSVVMQVKEKVGMTGSKVTKVTEAQSDDSSDSSSETENQEILSSQTVKSNVVAGKSVKGGNSALVTSGKSPSSNCTAVSTAKVQQGAKKVVPSGAAKVVPGGAKNNEQSSTDSSSSDSDMDVTTTSVNRLPADSKIQILPTLSQVSKLTNKPQQQQILPSTAKKTVSSSSSESSSSSDDDQVALPATKLAAGPQAKSSALGGTANVPKNVLVRQSVSSSSSSASDDEVELGKGGKMAGKTVEKGKLIRTDSKKVLGAAAVGGQKVVNKLSVKSPSTSDSSSDTSESDAELFSAAGAKTNKNSTAVISAKSKPGSAPTTKSSVTSTGATVQSTESVSDTESSSTDSDVEPSRIVSVAVKQTTPTTTNVTQTASSLKQQKTMSQTKKIESSSNSESDSESDSDLSLKPSTVSSAKAGTKTPQTPAIGSAQAGTKTSAVVGHTPQTIKTPKTPKSISAVVSTKTNISSSKAPQSDSSSSSDSDSEDDVPKSKMATNTKQGTSSSDGDDVKKQVKHTLMPVNTSTPTATETSSASLKSNGTSSVKSAKKTASLPFRRIKVDDIQLSQSLVDNSFEAKAGAKGSWGEKANDLLKHTQGRSFRHEKTKKKRGSYKGGAIDTGVYSIKFDEDDDD